MVGLRHGLVSDLSGAGAATRAASDLARRSLSLPDGSWGVSARGPVAGEGAVRGAGGGKGLPEGAVQGRNDYSETKYGGPCPPPGKPHHYVFTLYALDVDKCPVSGTFKGPDVLAAIRRHVLAQAALTGVYSLNPGVKA